jgi:hypothetical protein
MIKGVRCPYFGQYSYSGGVASYANGGSIGKAVSYSTAITRTDDNHAYGDDKIIETDKGKFQTGTLTLETSHLSQPVSKTILGLVQKSIAVGENTVIANVHTDGDEAPDLGIGIIEWHQINNTDKFRAVVLLRVYFAEPENAATTKGENVEWQTKTIEGTIQRSQEVATNGYYPWYYDAWFDSEAAADAFLRSVLGISLGVLTVGSSAGTAAGDTAITVSPTTEAGNKYYYKLSETSITAPAYGDEIGTGTVWTAWDGEADITAETGDYIYVAEVNDEGEIVKGGQATVTANEGS